MTTIGRYAFRNCSRLAELATGGGKGHTELTILDHAFQGCQALSSLKLDVKSIGISAFEQCGGLRTVDVAAESIAENAFQGCSSMSMLTVRAERIGKLAFANCSMTSLEVVAETVDQQAFMSCTALRSVSMTADKLDVQAFSGCSVLADVTVKAEALGNQLFENCYGLKTVTINGGNKSIGSNLFSGCQLSKLTITTKKIPVGCFTGLNVEELVLEKGVENIDESAFSRCTMITLRMASSIRSIGKNAFKDCQNLQNALGTGNSDISVPNARLGKGIFEGCVNLTRIKIDAETIGEEAFARMTGLENIEVTDRVKTISTHAFKDCTRIARVDLRENGHVATIEDEAFIGCSSLTKVRFPASLKKLGKNVFKGCSKGHEADFHAYYADKYSNWEKVEKPKGTKEKDQSAWTGLNSSRYEMKLYCKPNEKYKEFKQD